MFFIDNQCLKIRLVVGSTNQAIGTLQPLRKFPVKTIELVSYIRISLELTKIFTKATFDLFGIFGDIFPLLFAIAKLIQKMGGGEFRLI